MEIKTDEYILDENKQYMDIYLYLNYIKSDKFLEQSNNNEDECDNKYIKLYCFFSNFFYCLYTTYNKSKDYMLEIINSIFEITLDVEMYDLIINSFNYIEINTSKTNEKYPHIYYVINLMYQLVIKNTVEIRNSNKYLFNILLEVNNIYSNYIKNLDRKINNNLYNIDILSISKENNYSHFEIVERNNLFELNFYMQFLSIKEFNIKSNKNYNNLSGIDNKSKKLLISNNYEIINYALNLIRSFIDIFYSNMNNRGTNMKDCEFELLYCYFSFFTNDIINYYITLNTDFLVKCKANDNNSIKNKYIQLIKTQSSNYINDSELLHNNNSIKQLLIVYFKVVYSSRMDKEFYFNEVQNYCSIDKKYNKYQSVNNSINNLDNLKENTNSNTTANNKKNSNSKKIDDKDRNNVLFQETYNKNYLNKNNYTNSKEYNKKLSLARLLGRYDILNYDSLSLRLFDISKLEEYKNLLMSKVTNSIITSSIFLEFIFSIDLFYYEYKINSIVNNNISNNNLSKTFVNSNKYNLKLLLNSIIMCFINKYKIDYNENDSLHHFKLILENLNICPIATVFDLYYILVNIIVNEKNLSNYKDEVIIYNNNIIKSNDNKSMQNLSYNISFNCNTNSSLNKNFYNIDFKKILDNFVTNTGKIEISLEECYKNIANDNFDYFNNENMNLLVLILTYYDHINEVFYIDGKAYNINKIYNLNIKFTNTFYYSFLISIKVITYIAKIYIKDISVSMVCLLIGNNFSLKSKINSFIANIIVILSKFFFIIENVEKLNNNKYNYNYINKETHIDSNLDKNFKSNEVFYLKEEIIKSINFLITKYSDALFFIIYEAFDLEVVNFLISNIESSHIASKHIENLILNNKLDNKELFINGFCLLGLWTYKYPIESYNNLVIESIYKLSDNSNCDLLFKENILKKVLYVLKLLVEVYPNIYFNVIEFLEKLNKKLLCFSNYKNSQITSNNLILETLKEIDIKYEHLKGLSKEFKKGSKNINFVKLKESDR